MNGKKMLQAAALLVVGGSGSAIAATAMGPVCNTAATPRSEDR
jgi:hypothetical protein